MSGRARDVKDFMILNPSKSSLKTIEKNKKFWYFLDLDQLFLRVQHYRKRIGMEEDESWENFYMSSRGNNDKKDI